MEKDVFHGVIQMDDYEFIIANKTGSFKYNPCYCHCLSPLSEHCQPFHSSKFAATLSFYIDVHVCALFFRRTKWCRGKRRKGRDEEKAEKGGEWGRCETVSCCCMRLWVCLSERVSVRVRRTTEHSGTGCRLSSVWSWEMGTPVFHLLLTVIAFLLHLGINLRGVKSGSAWGSWLCGHSLGLSDRNVKLFIWPFYFYVVFSTFVVCDVIHSKSNF